jgi:formyltetrahydrofolate synthetase
MGVLLVRRRGGMGVSAYMPGLPKRPAAWNIDISADGVITGLYL